MDETALSEQVCLVTGSTKGIGKAIARELADHGATVVLNGRSGDTCEAVSEELAAATGSTVTFEVADINEYEQVETMVESVVDSHGGIDVVVANGAAAAGPPANFFREMDSEEFMEFCLAHFVNRMYVIKATLEPLIDAKGGRVISVTTDAGRVPTPGEFGPGTAGAAVIMGTRVLANEFKRWDITVNAVALTATKDTHLIETLTDESSIANVFQDVIDRQEFPLTPDRVAQLVTFLAGADGARPITGQTIPVTGGVSF